MVVLPGATPVTKPPLVIVTAAAFGELHVAELVKFLRPAVAVSGAGEKVVYATAKDRIDLSTPQLFLTFLALKFAFGESRQDKMALIEASC